MFLDLPHRVEGILRIGTSVFPLKPGVVVLADDNAFSQDATSVSQVGAQESGWAARAARLMFSGAIGGRYQVHCLIAGEYKGFESNPDTTWNVTDVSFTFPFVVPPRS